jgi:uncharacterized protein (TIGR03435 family)
VRAWLLGVGVTVISALGQDRTPAPRLKVEVASVKPSQPGKDLAVRIGGARLTVESYPLRDLIGAAYNIRLSELVGGPAWIAGARYDIAVKATTASDDKRELWRMMQSVLAERFEFRMHHEQREFPVLDLSILKSGKLPEPHAGGCLDGDPTNPLSHMEAGKQGLAPCGSIFLRPVRPGGLQLSGAHIQMRDLAQRLTDLFGRHVIDKTGFTAAFDLQVKFAWDTTIQGVPTRSPEDAAGALELPSIVTVLRNQLGLQLKAAKGLIDVIVIDHIEKPSGN